MKSYYLLFLILFLASCKESPLPPTIEGDPFFELPIKIDGADLKLSAGMEGYYLYTSFDQDDHDVYRFEGNIRPLDCLTCGPQLRIVFRDAQQRTDGSKPNVNDILKVKSYDFYGSQQDTAAYQTHFQVEIDNPNDFIYSWDLGDGTTATQPTFVHTYPTFPAAYDVNLEINNNICSSKINQRIDVPKAACFPEIGTEFTGNETRIVFNTTPQGGLNYNWNFGDGNTAIGANASHDFQARGAYTVCLSASSNNCSAMHCRNVEVGEADGCAVNFSYETIPVILPDSLGFGQIEVYWVDRNGKTYQSSLLPQPTTSFFQILEKDPYQANENGESTMAFTFSLNCKLFADNEELELSISNGKMAVAYPK